MFIVLSKSKPEEFLNNINREIRTDLQKYNLMYVLEMFYSLSKNSDQQTSIKETRIKLYYATELCKRDTSMTIRDCNFLSPVQFLAELRNKLIDVELIHRLSIDLNWDYQDVLITQITTILDVQELEFDVTTDVFEKEQIIVKASTEKILDLCQPYVNEVVNVDLLATSLIAYIDKVFNLLINN